MENKKIELGIVLTLSKVLDELNKYIEKGWMIYKISGTENEGLAIELCYNGTKENKVSKMLTLIFENEEFDD